MVRRQRKVSTGALLFDSAALGFGNRKRLSLVTAANNLCDARIDAKAAPNRGVRSQGCLLDAKIDILLFVWMS